MLFTPIFIDVSTFRICGSNCDSIQLVLPIGFAGLLFIAAISINQKFSTKEYLIFAYFTFTIVSGVVSGLDGRLFKAQLGLAIVYMMPRILSRLFMRIHVELESKFVLGYFLISLLVITIAWLIGPHPRTFIYNFDQYLFPGILLLILYFFSTFRGLDRKISGLLVAVIATISLYEEIRIVIIMIFTYLIFQISNNLILQYIDVKKRLLATKFLFGCIFLMPIMQVLFIVVINSFTGYQFEVPRYQIYLSYVNHTPSLWEILFGFEFYRETHGGSHNQFLEWFLAGGIIISVLNVIIIADGFWGSKESLGSLAAVFLLASFTTPFSNPWMAMLIGCFLLFCNNRATGLLR